MGHGGKTRNKAVKYDSKSAQFDEPLTNWKCREFCINLKYLGCVGEALRKRGEVRAVAREHELFGNIPGLYLLFEKLRKD